jgi:hypothetical protein
MADLRQLIRREGVDAVAKVAEVSPGQIKHFRSGSREIGVDVLFRLHKEWDDFDLLGTALGIGAVRHEKQAKAEEEENPKE